MKLIITHLLVIIPAIFAWIVFAGMFVAREPPVEIITPTVVTGGDFHSGGRVNLSMRINRKERCMGESIRTFVDSNGVEHILENGNVVRTLKTGEFDIKTHARIPRNAATGIGQYSVTIQFNCWPGQSINPIIVEMIKVPVTVK